MRRKVEILIFSCIAIVLAGLLTWGIIGCSKGGNEGKGNAETAQAINLNLQANPETAEIDSVITLVASVFSNTGAGMQNVNVTFRLVSSSGASSRSPMPVMKEVSGQGELNKIQDKGKDRFVRGDGSLRPVGKDAVRKQDELFNVKTLNELYEMKLLPADSEVIYLEDFQEGDIVTKLATSEIGLAEIKVTSSIANSSYTIDFYNDDGLTSNSVTITFNPIAGISCYLTIDEKIGNNELIDIDNNGLKGELFIWLNTPDGEEQLSILTTNTHITVDQGAVLNYLKMDAYLIKEEDANYIFVPGEVITFYASMNGGATVYDGIKFSAQPPSLSAGTSKIDVITDTGGKATVYFWGDYSVIGDNIVNPSICAEVKDYSCPSGKAINAECYTKLTFSPASPCDFRMELDNETGNYTVSIYEEENPGIITVTLSDENGLPVDGEIIQFSAFEGDSKTIPADSVKFKPSSGEVATDEDGKASIIFWGTEVGKFNLSAWAKDYQCLSSPVPKIYRTVTFSELTPYTFTATVRDEANQNTRTAFWVNDLNNPGTLVVNLRDHNGDPLKEEWLFVWAAYPGRLADQFDGVKFNSVQGWAIGPMNIQTDENGIASINFYSEAEGSAVFVAKVDDTRTGHYVYLNKELDWAVSSEIDFVIPDVPCQFDVSFTDTDGVNFTSDPSEPVYDTVTFTFSEFDYDNSNAETLVGVTKPVADATIFVQAFSGDSGTNPFTDVWFEAGDVDSNNITLTTDGNGQASVDFYVTRPGEFRINGRLQQPESYSCFGKTLQDAETQPLTYTHPDDCYITLSIKNASGVDVTDEYSGQTVYALARVVCNYKSLAGATVTFTISPDGAYFISSQNSVVTLETDQNGEAKAWFVTENTDISDTFYVDAEIVGVSDEDCKDICLNKSASDSITFAGSQYKVKITIEYADPWGLESVLGDGKHNLVANVSITTAGRPVQAPFTLSVDSLSRWQFDLFKCY